MAQSDRPPPQKPLARSSGNLGRTPDGKSPPPSNTPKPNPVRGAPSPSSADALAAAYGASDAEPAPAAPAAPPPKEPSKRRELPRLMCKKCGIVFSGAVPKDQRCIECKGPLVEADPGNFVARTPSPGNDTAAPTAKAPQGSPLLWAPGSSRRSELLVTRYLIKDPQSDILGSGAKGVVYRAQDRRMGNRPVAIKLFFDDGLDDLEAKREQTRTEREIRIQALLTHPAIVTAHDRFESPHGSGIVLEYIDGESLEERVKKKGVLPLREAVRVCIEVAKGVEYMHSHKVIHRDLKPSNVLITRDENIKIIDFGVAKYTGEDDPIAKTEAANADDATLTQEGMIVGTPSYMSPEQALGRIAFVDERSDIYGVGAILYFAMTGKAPFQGDDVEAILDRVRKTPPPPPSSWNPRIDAALESIVEKSMRKVPEQRFQNSAALVQQLKAYLDGEPLDEGVYREPISKRLARWLLEHKSVIYGTIATILIAAIVWLTYLGAERSAQARAVEQRLDTADEKLRALEVEGAIAIYNEVMKADPGNERARLGLDAAQKALVHVNMLDEGKRLLGEAQKALDPAEAELLYDRAYNRFCDAKAYGSRAPELENLLKRSRGAARVDVALPEGSKEATLRLVQLSVDLTEERLVTDPPIVLPVRQLELPTGFYQASVVRPTGEPWFFPIRIARGNDVKVEPVPTPPAGMVYVRGATKFRAGHPRHDDLAPVDIEPFFIDAREVTVGEYRQFLDSLKDAVTRKRRTPSHWTEAAVPEPADSPVTNVTLDDAVAYATFRGKDIPTEAQWQLAASGGLEDRDYPYGRRFVAAYACCTGTKPEAVGTRRHDRSPYGVLDTAGNVSELVRGFFDADATRRLAKGGSFLKKAPVWERIPVNGPDRSIGFRCCRSAR